MMKRMTKKNDWGAFVLGILLCFLTMTCAAGLTVLLGCAKPVEPADPFVKIKLETADQNSPDSTSYTGKPIQVTAVLDSAVPFGDIQWLSTGTAIIQSRHLQSFDTASTDTVFITWEDLPPATTISPDTATNKEVRYIDTIWAEFKGSASNKIIVAVANRPPSIDSVKINGRIVPLLNDSIVLAGNHSTMANILVYASDSDPISNLNAAWVKNDSIGRLVSMKDSTTLTSGNIWRIRWQAPSVEDAGDTTISTAALIRITDNEGGTDEIPIRIIIYRESGSIWVASTHEVGADTLSSLIKYSDNGKELFRIPGFKEISHLAVNPLEEVVWFTDRIAGRVYCYDDDGNEVFGILGFVQPTVIRTHNSRGYCYVVDIDTSLVMGSRLRIVNLDGNGNVDTGTTSFSQNSLIPDLIMDQNQPSDVWMLMINTTGTANDRIHYYERWWTHTNIIYGIENATSIDINNQSDEVWIADKGNNRIIMISMATDIIEKEVLGFLRPQMVAVNTADSSCWVTDTYNNQIVKLDYAVTDGYDISSMTGTFHTLVTDAFGVDFKLPAAIAVNPHEDGGVIWVIDTHNNRIVKLDSDGNALLSITEFGVESPANIAVNPGAN